MRNMKAIFPYLWQLSTLVNDLVEPTGLAKDLITGAEVFLVAARQLAPDERVYAAREVAEAVRSLHEATGVLEELRAKLIETGLADGGGER